jgi:hypothetical protein
VCDECSRCVIVATQIQKILIEGKTFMAMKKAAPKKAVPKKKGDEPVRAGRAAKQKPLSGEGYIKKGVVSPTGQLGPSVPNNDMGSDRAFRRAVVSAKQQNKGIRQKKMALSMKYKNRLERTKGQ